MTPRVRRKRPALFNTLAICTVVVVAMWLLSVWSTTYVGSPKLEVSLHRGIVRVSPGEVARFEQQSSQSRFGFGPTPFEWPASFGLHWPYWEGTITDFQLRVPLVAIWVPGAVVSGVLARRGPRSGCCHCGYDLTGNVSGRCPECGQIVGLRRDTAEADRGARTARDASRTATEGSRTGNAESRAKDQP